MPSKVSGSNHLNQYEKYEDSPYVIHGITDKVVLHKGSKLTITAENGRKWDMESAGVNKVVKYDPSPYVKVFKGSASFLSGLNKRGFVMLCMVIDRIKPRTHTIFLTPEDASAFSTSLSGSSYYVAITDLLYYGVIARSHIQYRYYVNPNVIYNGDRTKTYVKKPK